MPKGIPKNGINKGCFKKGLIPWNKGKINERWLGKNNPNWVGGQVKKHCILCGKEYYRDKNAVARSKFCSRSCRAKYNFTGEKHWFWKGGISSDRDKLKFSECYKKWRLKVFQRDKFTCKKCKHRSKKSKAHGDKTSDIHAHHIDSLSNNIKKCLKVGNGITLCTKCHRETYGKEKQFSKVFKETLNDYMPNKTKV